MDSKKVSHVNALKLVGIAKYVIYKFKNHIKLQIAIN